MANVSSSNGLEKYPKLRFKGFLEPWETVCLSDITTYQKERTEVTKTNYVSTENMLQNFLGLEPYLDESMIEGILFRKSDTLLANIRPYLRKTWFATENGACSTDVLAIHPTNVDPKFLYNVIAQNSFIDYVMSGAKGSKMPRGDKDHIMEYEIASPNNVYEQNKIADFLQLISDRIEKIQQLIEHLKKYKRGVISKILSRSFAFTHDTTIDWVSHKVGDFCSVQMCKRIFKEQTSPEGDVPFYKIGTIGGEPDAYISREVYEEYRRKYNFPRKGEFLISCAGTVGKCVVYNGEDSYYQDSNIVWLRNESDFVLNEYLYILVSNVDWSTLNSTTITRIYNDNLRDLVFDFPPIEEQKKISEFYTALDKRIEVEDSNLSHLLTLKQGLIQGLFA